MYKKCSVLKDMPVTYSANTTSAASAGYQVWGRDDLMAIAAFRYCCGRATYIVGDCVDWLIAHWSEFSPNCRHVIQRDLLAEFARDDEARAEGREYKPLGHDCDRREWERVKILFG